MSQLTQQCMQPSPSECGQSPALVLNTMDVHSGRTVNVRRASHGPKQFRHVGTLKDVTVKLPSVLMTTRTSGALDSVNVENILPYNDNLREMGFHYKEKAGRAQHAPDICNMHGALYRVEVRSPPFTV